MRHSGEATLLTPTGMKVKEVREHTPLEIIFNLD